MAARSGRRRVNSSGITNLGRRHLGSGTLCLGLHTRGPVDRESVPPPLGVGHRAGLLDGEGAVGHLLLKPFPVLGSLPLFPGARSRGHASTPKRRAASASRSTIVSSSSPP